MPAIITEAIPEQGFETVGKQLGAILTLELANQKTLQSFDESCEVFHERTAPYDKSEDVMVNVLLESIGFNEHTQSDMNGDTGFNIDVFANATSSEGKAGDTESMRLVQKYVGLCRYILSSTKYKTLGFDPGWIGGVYVQNVQVYEVDTNQDGRNVRMMRMTVMVRIRESQELWPGTLLTQHDSTIKLNETEKGFKYELIGA